MKRWRRPLILIALLLLAGAVVNVGVAWGIAAFGPKPPVELLLRAETSFDFSTGEPFEIPPPTVRLGAQEGSRGRPHWHERGDASGSVIRAGFGHWQCWGIGPSTHAFGWPVLTMKYVARPTFSGELHRSVVTAPDAMTSHGLFAKSGGSIPIGFIPRGALLNTLFYAAILALSLTLFPIRRRLRARRGRCPKCGYDLAGLGENGGADPAAPCPECGAAR